MMTRTAGAAMLVLCFGSCDDTVEISDPWYFAPPIPPPAATSVPFDDVTLEVGDSVVVESIRTLFTDHILMSFTASSSDTTVLGASVRGAVRLTITARMSGSADVSVTATEPGPDPNRPAGVGPQGRSATRTARVTVIDP